MHCIHGLELAPVISRSGSGAYFQEVVIDKMESVRAPMTNTHYAFVFKHGSFGDVQHFALMKGMKAWKLALANEQWQRHVFDPSSPSNVDSLTDTVEAVLDFIAEFGPSSIALSGFQPTAVQGEHLAALLRASSTWRDEIPGWHDALGVARAAIELAGLDPNDALFGMI